MAKLIHTSTPCNKIKVAQKPTKPQQLGVAASIEYIIIVNLLHIHTLIFPVPSRGVQWSGRRHGSGCAITDDSSCVRCVSIAVFDLVLTDNVGYCYIRALYTERSSIFYYKQRRYIVLLKCPTTKWVTGYILLCVCVYLGMLRWFTHFSTGKCIHTCSLHGCGTELIVYCSVTLSGIAT